MICRRSSRGDVGNGGGEKGDRICKEQRRALCVGETCWVGWSACGTGATSFQTQQHNGGRSGGLGQRRWTDSSHSHKTISLRLEFLTNHPLPSQTSPAWTGHWPKTGRNTPRRTDHDNPSLKVPHAHRATEIAVHEADRQRAGGRGATGGNPNL